MRLWQNKTDGTYQVKPILRTATGRVHVTKQIHPDGIAWLKQQGVTIGGELPDGAYWTLDKNGWLFTKGEIPFGGDVNWSPKWEAIGPASVQPRVIPKGQSKVSKPTTLQPATAVNSTDADTLQGCLIMLVIAVIILLFIIF